MTDATPEDATPGAQAHPKGDPETTVAVIALTEAQKLAAQRRASAEDELAQARAFEEHLAQEHNTIALLASAVEAARRAEREAGERVREKRENVEALLAKRESDARRAEELRCAEEAALAEVARAQEQLDLAQRGLKDARAARARPSEKAAPSDREVQADLEAALRRADECRDERARVEAEVAEMRARIELLSGTHGLSPDAVKRVVERRMADELRRGGKGDAA
jgi:hypothetical protein